MSPTMTMDDARKARVGSEEYVTIRVDDQLIGVRVLTVQDVLGPHKILPIPLSGSAIAGALNLRGRIVTAIDLRVCLDLDPCPDPSKAMSVVVEHENELYSFLVDDVGEVLTPPDSEFERLPANLSGPWRDVCSGVFRLPQGLLLVLDVNRLIDLVDGSLS